jgi:hypothetical protein
MTAKQLAAGTVVGAIVLSASGHFLFEIVLADFYAYALTTGSATGVQRESPLLWAVALGALSYGALVTLAIGNRGGSPVARTGIKIGAIVGFRALIDPALEVVPSAITGGAIAVVLRKVR